MKKGFEIPRLQEVAIYIQTKKSWPPRFVEYYADRFWNFYQSNGWKVSGRAAMKDWKAAFNSQWQFLKFKEDIDKLNECMKDQPLVNGKDDTVGYVEGVLIQYVTHPTQVPHERLASCYDWLKERELLRINPGEWKELKRTYAHDVVRGKAAAVGTTFERLYNSGKSISELVK
jgi:hypothetical protein